jgi:anthranilate synthase component 1
MNLKKINPSPYMYHLDFGERKIVGSSPEMLARVEGKKVLTYPIAGTRKRGDTPERDKELEEELLADEKERAEHLMLVDLGRNDIGRVAKFGSVKVNKFMGIEKYSHVQHIVSEVEGELVDDKDCFDALESIFPAGTVSGAPKVRAMEIINELEPSKRGVYAGSVGYFSFNGNMDTAISIRTVVFEKDKAYIQAGAGIVADSKPELEYKETVNKAKGMLKALEGI